MIFYETITLHIPPNVFVSRQVVAFLRHRRKATTIWETRMVLVLVSEINMLATGQKAQQLKLRIPTPSQSRGATRNIFEFYSDKNLTLYCNQSFNLYILWIKV